MKELFHQKHEPLTVKKLVNLFQPVFSEEGSNSRRLEKSVYALFLKYIREVASKIFIYIFSLEFYIFSVQNTKIFLFLYFLFSYWYRCCLGCV